MNYLENIKASGLKKKKIAQQLGITNVYFSYLINGIKKFTPEMEQRLRTVLGL